MIVLHLSGSKVFTWSKLSTLCSLFIDSFICQRKITEGPSIAVLPVVRNHFSVTAYHISDNIEFYLSLLFLLKIFLIFLGTNTYRAATVRYIEYPKLGIV